MNTTNWDRKRKASTYWFLKNQTGKTTNSKPLSPYQLEILNELEQDPQVIEDYIAIMKGQK